MSLQPLMMKLVMCVLSACLLAQAPLLRAQCPADAGSPLETCSSSGTNFYTLQGSDPGVGNSGLWTVVEGPNGGDFSDPTDPNSDFTTAPDIRWVLRWTVTLADTTTCSDDTVVLFETQQTANAGADQTGASGVCGQTATLSANAPVFGSGAWTIVAGDGNGYFGDTPGTVTSANASETFNGTFGQTYTLRWTLDPAGCNLTSDDVDVEFFEDVTPNAGADQNVCGTSTFLGAVPSVGTGAWSITSGAGGTVTTPSSATSAFNGVVGTTYTLTWTETNGSCTGNDTVSITFFDNPTAAAAGADQEVCAGTTTLAGNSAAGFMESGSWAVVAGAGGSFGDATSPTSTFTGTRGVSYTLRWTITNGVCPISSDDVVIDFNEDVTPNAGADQDVCGTSTFLGASLSTGTDGSWSILSGAGGTVTTPTSPTSSFNGTVGTTYTLQWTENNGACSGSDTVTITFFDNPTASAAGPDQTLCSDTATLAANAAAGFQESGSWSVVAGAGGSFSDATSPTATFTGTKGVSYTLRWTITNGVCPISSDDVVIDLLEDLTASAGADQNVCGTSTNLAAALSTGSGGTWSILSGAGGSITTPASATSAFTGTVDTTYVLQWEEDNGTCTDTDTVTITFYDSPAAAAGADQDICGGTTVLAANAASGLDVTGSWAIVAGDGNGYFGSTPGTTSSTNEADDFTGTIGQSYTLRWTLTNGVCPISSDDVVINFTGDPTTADAGSNQTVCPVEGGTLITRLVGNQPGAGESGMWSVLSSEPGGAVSSFEDATAFNSRFTGDLNAVYQLRWTITPDVGPCPPSTDDVQIAFGAPAPEATATDQTVCADNVTLDGNDPSGRTAVWSIVSGDDNGYFSGTPGTLTSNNPTDSFNGTRGTAYSLRYTIESGSLCVDRSVDVTITLEDDPTPANAGPDQTGGGSGVCALETALAANTPTVGTGVWSITGVGDGNGVLTDPTDPTTTFAGTGGQTYTLTWTVSNGTCVDSTDTVDIEFFDGEVALAGPDQNVCSDPTRMTEMGGSTALNDNAPTTDTLTIADPGAGNYPNGATILGAEVTVQVTHTALSQLDISLQSPMGTTVVLFDGSTKCDILDGVAPLGFRDGATGDICRTLERTVLLPQFIAPQEALSGFNGEAVVGMWTLTVTDTETGETGTLDNWFISFRTQSVSGSATLAGNTPSAGTGTWTISNGDGNGYFGVTPGTTTSVNPTDTFTGTAGQSYTLQWEITGAAPCPISNDTVVINFQSDNDAVAANNTVLGGGSGYEACAGTDMIQLDAQVEPANATSGTWSITAGDGNGYFDGVPGTLTSNLPNATFHGTAGQDYTLDWSVTNSCDTSNQSVAARFAPAPSTADAGNPVNTCPPVGSMTGVVVLEGVAPAVGDGYWSIESADPAINLGGETFSDATSPTSMFTGNVGTTYVLRWEVFTGIQCVSSDTTQVIIKELPQANAGADQTLCAPITILSGNDPGAGSVVGTWRVRVGDGNAAFGDVNVFNTTFTGTRGFTYTLEWELREDVCLTTDTVQILLVEDPIATASNQQTCTTEVTLDGGHDGTPGALPSRGTGTWSIVSTSPGGNTNGRFGSTGTTTSTLGTDTFTGDEGVSYTLQWFLTNSPCRDDSIDITVDFLEAPDTPDAGSDQTVCAGGARMMQALGPDAIPDDGSSSFTNTISVDRFGTITDLDVMLNFEHANANELQVTLRHDDTGTTVTLVNGLACGAAAAGMRIYDDEAADLLSCATGYQQPFSGVVKVGASALAQFDGEGLAGDWTLTVTDGVPGNTGQITGWGLNFNQGTVNLAGLPDPLTDVAYMGNWEFADAGNVDDLGFFTAVPGTTSTTPANAGFTTTFTGSAGSSYTLAFKTANEICDLTDNVVITFDEAPTLATAGPDQDVCGAAATLAGNTPGVGTGTWSISSVAPLDGDLPMNPGGESFDPDANTPGATFNGNRGYAYTLTWTVTNGTCGAGNADDVVINLHMDPATADAGADAAVCDTLSTNLAGNTPGAGMGEGTWTFTGPGGIVFTTTDAGSYPDGANDPGAQITADTLGTYVFTWTIASGNCTASTDTVSITFGTSPTVANAGPDQTGAGAVCDGQAELAANAPGVGEGGRWTYTGPDMNGVFSDDSSPTSTFTGTIGETYTLTWTISNGVCLDSSDDVDVEFRPILVPDAGADQLVCDQDPATLTAVLSTGTGGTWSLLTDDGNGMIASPGSTTTTFTGTTGFAYVLQWEETDGVCSATDDVNVTFFSTPVAEAGADFSACLIDTITLGASDPTTGTGTWTVETGPNGAVTSFDNANSPTAVFTTDLVGTYVLQWEVVSGSCVLADTVTLTIQDVDVLVPVSVAQGLDIISLEATPTCFSNDITIQWRDVTNASDFPTNTNPISLDPAPTATNIYQVTVDENGNANTATSQVIVLVGQNSDFLDLNGDGCNDAEDVAFLADDWRTASTADANGDGIIDVLDFLYIRTGEVCP